MSRSDVVIPRMWNFTDPASLDETVWEEFPSPTRARARRNSPQSPSRFKLAVVATALSLSFGAACVAADSSPVYRLTPSVIAERAETLPQSPLDALFFRRFDSEWTAEHELRLASQLDARRLEGRQLPTEVETAEVVYFNQNDDTELVAPKMSREDVASVLRHRRRRR